MKVRMLLSIAVLLLSTGMHGATLQPQTERFYQNYLQSVEKRLGQRGQFLLVEQVAGLRARVKDGEMFVEERRPEQEPPEGLIHHYEGAVFLPGANLGQVMALVQNYDQHKRYYAPEVLESQILERNGNDFLVRLRLLKKKVITVVLETQHKVRYKQLDAQKWESVSRSVKVSEVDRPGTDREQQQPQGSGNGFVWHLDSFWRFQEADGGVYVECTSVSLSRDVPFGMGRMIRPIIAELPEESLRGVLSNTRKAMQK